MGRVAGWVSALSLPEGLFAGENVTLRIVGANAAYTGAPPIFSLDSDGVVIVRASELSEGVIRLVRYRFVGP